MLLSAQVGHVALRNPDAWAASWLWDTGRAVSSYDFSLILLGPGFAGFGAWHGRRLRDAAWFSRREPIRALRQIATEAGVVILAVYSVPLVALVIAQAASGTPVVFAQDTEWHPLVAIAALAAYWTAGAALGVAWRSRLAPPVATAVAFVLTMAAWMGGYESLVAFGYSGGWSPGSAFGAATYTARLLLIVGVLLLSGRRILRTLRLPTLRDNVVGALGVALVSSGLVAGSLISPANAIVERDEPLACVTEPIFVCVERAWRHRLDDAARIAADPEVLAAYEALSEVSKPRGVVFGDRILRASGDVSGAERTFDAILGVAVTFHPPWSCGAPAEGEADPHVRWGQVSEALRSWTNDDVLRHSDLEQIYATWWQLHYAPDPASRVSHATDDEIERLARYFRSTAESLGIDLVSMWRRSPASPRARDDLATIVGSFPRCP